LRSIDRETISPLVAALAALLDLSAQIALQLCDVTLRLGSNPESARG
jgi:hypothetical protein